MTRRNILPTAPQGNVTRASHQYVTKRRRSLPNATPTLNSGEAGCVNDHDAVFAVFRAFRDDLGSLDRVVVNAGIGKGQPLGTGYFHANLQTAQTNFVAALAQCEAAMEVFREQNAGHLVMVSSMSAHRGLPKNLTTYAASKAAVASLAEGIRADTLRTPIAVTTLFPGYIVSEMNDGKEGRSPLLADTEPGVRAMIAAMEKEKAEANVPPWPWAPLGFVMRHLPLGVVSRFV